LIGDDPQGTEHPRIMMAKEVSMPWDEVRGLLDKLADASREFDCGSVVSMLREAPTGYSPNGDVVDLVWCNSQRDQNDQDARIAKIHHLPGVNPH